MKSFEDTISGAEEKIDLFERGIDALIVKYLAQKNVGNIDKLRNELLTIFDATNITLDVLMSTTNGLMNISEEDDNKDYAVEIMFRVQACKERMETIINKTTTHLK